MTNKTIIEQILSEKIPSFLYHYTTSAGLKGIIKSGNIWTTKTQYLNDKLELKLTFDYICEEIKQQKKGIERTRTDEELNNMVESLECIQDVNISVASFTKNGDLLSQWRGYCNIGSGYSLGFDGPMLQKKVNEDQKYRLVPCVYEEETQKQKVKELVDKTSVVNVKNSPGYGKPPFYYLMFAEAALSLALIIKSNSFKEEEEWRLISLPFVESEYSNANFREGNFSLIPYWEYGKEIDLLHTLRKVIIGPTPEPKLSEKAVQGLLMKKNPEYRKQIEVCRSKIPLRGK